MQTTQQFFRLPANVPVSSIYIDESGARNSRGGFFVVGFIKVREPAQLSRKVRDVRQRHNFTSEIHFSQITKRNIDFYFDIVETLATADVRVGGSVYDSKRSFTNATETWKQQARMATQLVVGNVNRGEFVNVFMDMVQTPKDKTFAKHVKAEANRRLASRCVLEAYDVDSRATDLLQLADIVASAINFERKQANPKHPTTPKGRVAARLRRALEIDSFADISEGKVNIMTMIPVDRNPSQG